MPVVGRPATIDDVLDADRHAMQRPEQPARHRFGFGRLRSLHGGLAIETDDGVELRIECAMRSSRSFHELDGDSSFSAIGVAASAYTKPVQFGHGSVPQ